MVVLPVMDRNNELKRFFIEWLIETYPEITILGTEVDGKTKEAREATWNGKGVQFAKPGSTLVFCREKPYRSDEEQDECDVTWYENEYLAYALTGVSVDEDHCFDLKRDLQVILKKVDEFAKWNYPQFHYQKEQSVKNYRKFTIPEFQKIYHLKNGMKIKNSGDLMIINDGYETFWIPEKLGNEAKYKVGNDHAKALDKVDRIFKQSPEVVFNIKLS